MVSQRTAAHECISEDALVHLKSYKYASVDKSYLSHYVLGPYWNAFVKLLPLWLAPNMVTLLGFMFILVNIAFVVVLVPDLIGPGPTWVYYSFAFGLWMYQTMDNVDGKQARRTGTSSGLGELFDHGIDSLNCTLASLLEAVAMGFGPTKIGAFTALVPVWPMFFSTWETYHTHTLYLGYCNGPTEGLVIACSVMLISAYFGQGFWDTRLPEFISIPSSLSRSEQLVLRDLWLPMIFTAFFFAHLPSCVINVYKARRNAGLPFAPTLLEWAPIIVYSLSAAAWLGSPHSITLRDNHLVLFCVTQSFVFGRMTTKVILAHLTRQPFPYWTILILPLVAGALLVNGPVVGVEILSPQSELMYLWAYFVFAVAAYSRWAYLVINAICEYLNITCFTVPIEKQRAAKKARIQNGKVA